MNQKCLSILKFLSQTDVPMTASQIAEEIGVSSRTIKSYISEINNNYKDLVKSGKNGYNINKKEVYEVIYRVQSDSMNALPQNYEDRSRYMIKKLIDAKEVDLDDLSDEIYVSSQTLINDIKKMNTQYGQYNVVFNLGKGKITVEGTEKDKRKFISMILRNEASDAPFDISYLQQQFVDYDVETLSIRTRKIFESNNFYLNEFNYSNLLLHILIIVSRNNYDESSVEKEIDESVYNITNEIVEMIETECDVVLSENSIMQLSILLLCNAINPEKAPEAFDIGSDIKTGDFVDEIIRKIKDDYGVDLSSDIFKLPFLLHMNNLYNRLSNNMVVYNPLGDGIRKSCPTIYEIAMEIALEIKNQWGFTLDEDEVAFIALHIGGEIQRQQQDEAKQLVSIVAVDYHEIRTWLYNQIMINFGSRVKIDKFYNRIEDVKDKTSVIIALQNDVNLNDYPNAICVKAYSSLPNMEIIEVLDRVREQDNLNVLFNTFDSIFKPELFITDAKGDSYQVIWQMNKLLMNDNAVTSHFYQRVLNREEASSTAFGQIAIPHSTKFDGLKTEICVAISPEGIKWRDTTVNVMFLIAVNKIDSIYFRDVFGALIQLFEDEEICEKIVSCKCFEDFKKTLSTIIKNPNIQ